MQTRSQHYQEESFYDSGNQRQFIATNPLEISPRSPAAPLRKNLFYVASGQAFYTLCQLGIVASLAKLGEPSVVGYFALCIALTTPIVELTGCQLHVVQATDTRGRFELADYLFLRLLTGILAGLILAGFLAISALPYSVQLSAVIMAYAKLVEGCSLICHGRFQRDEQMGWVARSQIARGALALAATAMTYYVTKSLPASMLALASVWTLVFLLHDFALAWTGQQDCPNSRDEPRGPRIVRLARESFPLGLGVGLNALSANLPRYFVGGLLGSYPLGIFAALGYVGIGARLLYLPVIYTVMPRLARFYHAGDRPKFIKLMTKGILIGSAISIVTLLFATHLGRPFLRILYTPEYSNYHRVFVILTGSVILHFLAALCIAALQAAQKFGWVFLCYAISIAVLAICLPLFTLWAEINGAPNAMLFASIAELSASVLLVAILLRALLPKQY